MLNIKKLREAKGLTQKELVELTGIPQGTISMYEKGYDTVKCRKLENIEKISKALDISVNTLLGRSETENLENIACLNQVFPLNKKKKCDNPVVLSGRAPCYGKDRVKEKEKVIKYCNTQALFVK